MERGARSEKPAIIALGPHPWEEDMWMNRQHLLSRLGARGWPVVYSSGALDLWNRRGEAWAAAGWSARYAPRDNVILYYPGRGLPRYRKCNPYDKWVLRRFVRSMRATTGAVGTAGAIIASFHPSFWPYVAAVPECVVWFHAFDDFPRTPGWTPDDAAMLTNLTQRADLVTCSSELIRESICNRFYQRCFTVENGADVAAFAPTQYGLVEPADLAEIPRPRVLYSGMLNRKVGFGTVACVAASRPRLHWVLVGENREAEILADATLSPHYRACRSLPNVHFLGGKRREQIPDYVHFCDVLAMCYRMDGEGWWKSIFPLKLHEYMASGKPVVSSRLHALVKFEPLLPLCANDEEWIRAIDRALAGTFSSRESVAIRRRVAEANSWDRKVDELEGHLEGLASRSLTDRRSRT